MLKRVRKRVFAHVAEGVMAYAGEQHERLDYIINEAMDAWERSKLNAESEEVTTEETEIEAPSGFGGSDSIPATSKKTKRISKGQCGDPRYLEQARGAMADQRDIWGIEAPKRTEQTTTERRVINLVEVNRPATPAIGSAENPIEVNGGTSELVGGTDDGGKLSPDGAPPPAGALGSRPASVSAARSIEVNRPGDDR
jgi:hypothetical protein